MDGWSTGDQVYRFACPRCGKAFWTSARRTMAFAGTARGKSKVPRIRVLNAMGQHYRTAHPEVGPFDRSAAGDEAWAKATLGARPG